MCDVRATLLIRKEIAKTGTVPGEDVVLGQAAETGSGFWRQDCMTRHGQAATQLCSNAATFPQALWQMQMQCKRCQCRKQCMATALILSASQTAGAVQHLRHQCGRTLASLVSTRSSSVQMQPASG